MIKTIIIIILFITFTTTYNQGVLSRKFLQRRDVHPKDSIDVCFLISPHVPGSFEKDWQYRVGIYNSRRLRDRRLELRSFCIYITRISGLSCVRTTVLMTTERGQLPDNPNRSSPILFPFLCRVSVVLLSENVESPQGWETQVTIRDLS